MENNYPIGGYAPGNYQCHCCDCGVTFHGDKRAVQCEPCAVTAKEKFDALPGEEKQEVIKRNIEAYNEFIKTYRENEQLSGTDRNVPRKPN